MERRQGEALAEQLAAAPDARMSVRHKAEPGDLRGIPVIGHGVGGVSPGTSPASSITRLDAERERRRRSALVEPMVGFA